MAEDESEDPAAAAFEALRGEVAQLRESLEALPTTFKVKAPPDYAPTLGAIAKSLAATEAHPAMRLTPQSHATQMQAATEALRSRVEDDLRRAVTAIAHASSDINRFAGDLRTRHEQRRWLIVAGAGGMAAGALLWVLVSGPIARALPESWHVPEKMAAATLRLDRWDAGMQLMRSASPQSWARLAQAAELERANRKALDDCREAVAKTGKAQRCAITLTALPNGQN